jgi:hypothetical protein
MEKASKASEVVLELQDRLNKSENDLKAVEHQKEQLEAQVAFYQPQVEQLQNQLQLAEHQCQLLEKRMNETSEAAAAVQQIEVQQLEGRQAVQPLTQAAQQPVDTWAQLAPTGPVGSEMQAGGGGGWAPHVWGQAADDSAASFFDQPLQPTADNATAQFFDSPQVQQSQVS